jgi:hypothetical protein
MSGKSRRITIRTQGGELPLKWFLISFGTADEWMGACIVRGCNELGAIRRAEELGINLYQRMLVAEDDRIPPPEAQDRALNYEEFQKFFGPLEIVSIPKNLFSEGPPLDPERN